MNVEYGAVLLYSVIYVPRREIQYWRKWIYRKIPTRYKSMENQLLSKSMNGADSWRINSLLEKLCHECSTYNFAT